MDITVWKYEILKSCCNNLKTYTKRFCRFHKSYFQFKLVTWLGLKVFLVLPWWSHNSSQTCGYVSTLKVVWLLSSSVRSSSCCEHLCACTRAHSVLRRWQADGLFNTIMNEVSQTLSSAVGQNDFSLSGSA